MHCHAPLDRRRSAPHLNCALCPPASQERQPLHIIMVESSAARSVLPHVLRVREPLNLSVVLMDATPEVAEALLCDGAVVREGQLAHDLMVLCLHFY